VSARRPISGAFIGLAAILLLCGSAKAQQAGKSDPAPASSSARVPVPASQLSAGASDTDLRIEGEKRFRANCGRCHQAPHKFPPRMMATIVRHMRVRAMLTDEDMKAILAYMTQ
jgi:mono/diheme cytochrome c family protein